MKSPKSNRKRTIRTDGDADASTEKQLLCIKCKKCCQEIGLFTYTGFYEDTEEEVVHFYQTRGFNVVRDKTGLLYLTMKLSCPHLTKEGCDMYEHRPEICRKYSGREEYGDACLWSTLDKKK
ncbi:MAG TPA: YkgJ family cysteine cluster protein [Dissulfurispiraceae bacterium]|nr:YkgJ family cysteine cluster protein [Dissulfurispiraceae bacterium]